MTMLFDFFIDYLTSQICKHLPNKLREYFSVGSSRRSIEGTPDVPTARYGYTGPFSGTHNCIIHATVVEKNDYVSNGKPVLDVLHPYTEPAATMDSNARDPPPKCHPGTRVHLCKKLMVWLDYHEQECGIMWLYGPARTGKSAIAQTFAETCFEMGRLGAAFFFSRLHGCNKPETVIPTIAYQLAIHCPAYKLIISQIIADDPQLLLKAIAIQFKRLIIEPFVQLQIQKHESVRQPFLVLLDGLDECAGARAQCDLIEMISELVRMRGGFPILWLVCSRPEPHLKQAFSSIPECDREELLLDRESREDVERFLRDGFAKIRDRHPFPIHSNWPSSEKLRAILRVSSGFFQVASIALEYVGDSTLENPMTQLDSLVASLTHEKDDWMYHPLAPLDRIYKQIISDIPPKIYPISWRILAHLCYLSSSPMSSWHGRAWRPPPPPAQILSNILRLEQNTFYAALQKLHSVLKIPPPEDAARVPLMAHHTSFQQFLLSVNRAGEFVLDRERVFVEVAKTYLYWYQAANSGCTQAPRLTWATAQSDSAEGCISLEVARHVKQHACDVFKWCPQQGSEDLFAFLSEFDFRYVAGHHNIQHLVNWVHSHYPASGLVRTKPTDSDADVKLIGHLNSLTNQEVVNSGTIMRTRYREFFLLGHGLHLRLLALIQWFLTNRLPRNGFWNTMNGSRITAGTGALAKRRAGASLSALDCLQLCSMTPSLTPSGLQLVDLSQVLRGFITQEVSISRKWMQATNIEKIPNKGRPDVQNVNYNPFAGAHDFVINNPTMIESANFVFSSGRSVLEILLPYTDSDAATDSSARDPPPKCHPGTRVHIISKLEIWLDDAYRGWSMLWLYGPAGTGKSAVAQTFAETCYEQGRLGAAFFFSRPNGRDKPMTVVPSLVYQLSINCSAYKSAIAEILANDPQLLRKSIAVQFKQLIIEPISRLQAQGHESLRHPFLILLDGLDECAGGRSQGELIKLVSDLVRTKPCFPILWLLCSRPEPHLKHAFSRIPECGRLELLLDKESWDDVEKFLRDSFAGIREENPYTTPPDWPPEQQIIRILRTCSGHFQIASVAVNFVNDPIVENPVQQLDTLHAYLTRVEEVGMDNPLAALDLIYTRILSDIPSEILLITRQILAHLSFTSRVNSPPTTQILCNILRLDQNRFFGALAKLHSVIRVSTPEDARRMPVQFYHASFQDFLHDPGRSRKFVISRNFAFEDVAIQYLDWYQIDRTRIRSMDGGSHDTSSDAQSPTSLLGPLTWASTRDFDNTSIALSKAVNEHVWDVFLWGSQQRSDKVLAQLRNFDFRLIENRIGIGALVNWVHSNYPSDDIVRTEPTNDVDLRLLEYLKIFTSQIQDIRSAELPGSYGLRSRRYKEYFLLGCGQKATIILFTQNVKGFVRERRLDVLDADNVPTETKVSEYWEWLHWAD
ncbi:hypothetical protein D9756_008242 [Leucocoprinus leucothites]|uniref:Nephrocystin 3-like N-terminal domain-containing protein n=1 Tax=Leucocoprinus leucothites TaxID=201217 RepID=A0A8H5FW45_9AGAR|nr:hypothetical protein D9756_008242 [Leucoagaricus leucothites]